MYVYIHIYIMYIYIILYKHCVLYYYSISSVAAAVGNGWGPVWTALCGRPFVAGPLWTAWLLGPPGVSERVPWGSPGVMSDPGGEGEGPGPLAF